MSSPPASFNSITFDEVNNRPFNPMDDLRDNAPEAHATLLLAVGASLSDRLRRANAEIRALSR